MGYLSRYLVKATIKVGVRQPCQGCVIGCDTNCLQKGHKAVGIHHLPGQCFSLGQLLQTLDSGEAIWVGEVQKFRLSLLGGCPPSRCQEHRNASLLRFARGHWLRVRQRTETAIQAGTASQVAFQLGYLRLQERATVFPWALSAHVPDPLQCSSNHPVDAHDKVRRRGRCSLVVVMVLGADVCAFWNHINDPFNRHCSVCILAVYAEC